MTGVQTCALPIYVVIDRLPLYFRLLSRLEHEGRAVISSQELGEELGVTPAQIRKDLSYFGRFGKQGRGYSVARLAEELRFILGLDRRWRVVVVGIGSVVVVVGETEPPPAMPELASCWYAPKDGFMDQSRRRSPKLSS